MYAIRVTPSEDAKLAKIAPALGVSTAAQAVRILVRKAIA